MRGLLHDVVASDRAYFALGAEVHELGGARLLHLPGSQGVGAGTVVWVDDPSVIVGDPGWVVSAQGLASSLGAPALRVYGLGSREPAAAHLAAAGLAAREEIAFVATATATAAAGARATEVNAICDLRPALGEAGRRARRIVAAAEERAPDGHRIDVDAYLSGEERRAAAGGMDLFVGWDGDEPVAIAGLLRVGDVLRLKNLLVRPDRRRRGVARSVVATMIGWAEDTGLTLAAVALGDEPGEGIYRSLDMEVAGSFTEWSVALGAPAATSSATEAAP